MYTPWWRIRQASPLWSLLGTDPDAEAEPGPVSRGAGGAAPEGVVEDFHCLVAREAFYAQPWLYRQILSHLPLEKPKGALGGSLRMSEASAHLEHLESNVR